MNCLTGRNLRDDLNPDGRIVLQCHLAMPHSIDPDPADDETECARCGAHFSIELTRCPNCGVNLYEPEEESEVQPKTFRSPKRSLGERLDGFIRRLTRKPYAVDELFGAAINQAELFNDLLGKVSGDRQAAERLIEFERGQLPQGNRIRWIRNAIQRWGKDNDVSRNA